MYAMEGYEPVVSFGVDTAAIYDDTLRGDGDAPAAFLEQLADGGPALELALYNLLTQAEQVRCFQNVAAHLSLPSIRSSRRRSRSYARRLRVVSRRLTCRLVARCGLKMAVSRGGHNIELAFWHCSIQVLGVRPYRFVSPHEADGFCFVDSIERARSTLRARRARERLSGAKIATSPATSRSTAPLP